MKMQRPFNFHCLLENMNAFNGKFWKENNNLWSFLKLGELCRGEYDGGETIGPLVPFWATFSCNSDISYAPLFFFHDQ